MKSIHVDRVYPHPVDSVWRALTDRQLLGRWLMPNDFEPRLGHRFTLRTDPAPGFDGIIHCEVLEYDAPRRMLWSWRGGPLDTKVAFELSAVEGGTRLRMTHSGFQGLKSRIVRLILAIGSRKIYGRELPAVLDQLSGAPAERACMSTVQLVLAWCARLVPGRPKQASPNPEAKDNDAHD